jgi:hypothetical protein
MHPMSRLGNGDRPPRRMRRKVLQLPGRTVPFATRHAQVAPLVERVFDLPFIASGTRR